MGRRGRGAAAVGAAGLIAFVAAGCSLLFGSGFGPLDPDLPSSSPIAEFSDGSATIVIDGGERIVLDVLDAQSRIDALFGSDVHWSNADGWHLRVNGAGSKFGGGVEIGSTSFLTLDRITEGSHWTTYDPTRCIVEVEVADETALRGTATCRGLEWYDALGSSGMTEPKDVGEPEFDAEITFEATP